MSKRLFLLLALLLCAAAPAAAANQAPRAVVIYTTDWCYYCKQAMEYLTRHNIPYVNRNIEKDEAAARDILEKYKTRGVPLIVIGKDEKIIRGFQEAALDRELLGQGRNGSHR